MRPRVCRIGVSRTVEKPQEVCVMLCVVVAGDWLEMASGTAASNSRMRLASGSPSIAISLGPAIQRERAGNLSLPRLNVVWSDVEVRPMHRAAARI